MYCKYRAQETTHTLEKWENMTWITEELQCDFNIMQYYRHSSWIAEGYIWKQKWEKCRLDFLKVDNARQIWHLSLILNTSGLDWSIWFNAVEGSINEAAEMETGSTQISGSNGQQRLAMDYAEISIMRLQTS